MRKHKDMTPGEQRRADMEGTGEERRGEEKRGEERRECIHVKNTAKERKKKRNESVCLCAIIGRRVNSGVRLSYALLLSKARGFQKGFKEPQQHHKAPGACFKQRN